MLQLSDGDYKTIVMKMPQLTITNTLEISENLESLSKEKDIKENQTEIFRSRKYSN